MSKILLLALHAALIAGVVSPQDARIVDVDGLRIRARVGGLEHVGKAPVVVFEAGARSGLEVWNDVFDAVAAAAPVVAYDRAGNGQSTGNERAFHPFRVADTLHALLARLGLEGPYVLVGHSWGGPLIRVFAGRYSNDVAGLVYVDPTDMRSREEDVAYFRAQGYSLEAMAARKNELTRAAPATGELSAILAIGDTYYEEFRSLPQPAVPVVVLMSTRFDASTWSRSPCEPRACQETWIRYRTRWLRDYITGTDGGTIVTSEMGGHALQNDEPALVVSAIRRVAGLDRR